MGDAMDGVQHSQRPIAKPRTRKVTVKRTSKRKSAGGSGESSSAASLNPTPSKKAKIEAAVPKKEHEESWAVIAQNHTVLLESHANFLSTLLKKSQPSSSRTPALVGFLSRTHELLAQVKTLEAISPPSPSSLTKPTPNSSLPRQTTTPPPSKTKTKKMEGLEKEPRSIVLDKRKRTRSPSPGPSPEELEGGEREESPMKKIKSAPHTPAVPLKSSLKSKLGIRTAGAQFDKTQIPRTPTVVTASTSAASSAVASAPQQWKTEVKVEVQGAEYGDSTEVSLMEPDEFAAEVAERMRETERRKNRLVEGSKSKRRRRSSTVDTEERRREKRVKRESISAGGEDEANSRKRRSSGVATTETAGRDEESRGRR